MAQDLLARLTATKRAAERELEFDAERVDTARLEGAVADLTQLTEAARDLTRLIDAHRNNDIAIAMTGGDHEARVRSAAQALGEADGLDGEHAARLALDAERVYEAAEPAIQASLHTSRTIWLDKQPRPNQAFTAVFRDLAPSDMDATEAALADVEELAGQEIDTPEMLERLSRAVGILVLNYDRLTASAPEFVRNFLEQVPSGVALSEVSDAVVDWLRENRADHAFTIILRAE